MKSLLIFILLFPFFAIALTGSYFNRIDVLKDSTCKPVSLPEIWSGDFRNIFEVGKNSAYQYVVKEEPVYYRIFSRFSKDSLPVIDFSKQELVVHIACSYCIGTGYKDNEPHHRNACSYKNHWCLRPKKKE